ncbi:MAG: BolA family protein [Burkholderiales bacterium]
MNVEAQIRQRLSRLQPLVLEILDESAAHAGHAGARPGGETHWRLRIVAEAFRGKPTVARHRMVYDALGELINDPIHALAISARAPEEAGA